MEEGKLFVSKMRNGTVIDHIPAGKGLKALAILGKKGVGSAKVAILVNAESRKLGRKDMVKVEGRRVGEDEASLIALIAPEATICIVDEYKVAEKHTLSLPKTIKGAIRCTYTRCISNNDSEAESEFRVLSSSPMIIECTYCVTRISEFEVASQF
jgi:aspartate carbamoyltransferase regulatory subunit